jgi:RNA polymerase sigma factor (sigma-70 family)
VITQTNHTSAIDFQNHASDENLVHACRRGEGNAWDVLVHRYQRLIYTIPRRAGLDEDQAAEVFQRTFARLLENLDRIRQPEAIHAWLVTTAKRETLHLIRQQRVEQSFSSTEYPDFRSKHDSTHPDDLLPNEALERLEEQHLIRMAVTSMDERCRCLLTLLYSRSDPPSYAEVAAALDMPEGSLGPTRARCLEKLRRLLERAGF